MEYVVLFFAGASLCNCVPHLASGLRGEPFPTPFARPRGIGHSSPLVNFYWGTFNLVIGAVLLTWHPVAVAFAPDFIALLAGALALGSYLARRFGRVRADRAAG
jgi:hypothetical protein